MLLISHSAYAIKVAGLYQSTVQVKNESAIARQSGIKQALINVLIKLTGERNINKDQNVLSLIERPDRYVQQFRYSQRIDEKTNDEINELWVQFDEKALNDAIRSYGLSLWGKERPSILVWLANEEQSTRRMVSFEQRPEYISLLDNRASARGISLLFPLLDLEDSAQLSISDIWGGFKEPVLNASQRYQSDIVLTAKLIQLLPTLWEASWIAYADDKILDWTSRGELADIVLEEGIDELADRLAQQYTNTGSTRTELIELKVVDINSLDNYARALSYLESLQSVSTVNVKKVSENNVLFELISHGGHNVIDQAIVLGKTLEYVDTTEELTYRLLPR